MLKFYFFYISILNHSPYKFIIRLLSKPISNFSYSITFLVAPHLHTYPSLVF